MQIRRATKGDIEGIDKLLCQVLEIHASGRPDIFKAGTKKYSDAELCEILACEDTPIFVATEQDTVKGYAFCVIKRVENNSILRDRCELYIDDLCVDSSARGGGIGTRLFEYVKGYAYDIGCDAITLNVWSLNDSAMRFYEKCGFEPLKVVMEKKLHPDGE